MTPNLWNWKYTTCLISYPCPSKPNPLYLTTTLQKKKTGQRNILNHTMGYAIQNAKCEIINIER